MDDELEVPQFEHSDVKRALAPNDEVDGGGESSGDEDGADWSKFPLVQRSLLLLLFSGLM